MMFLLIVFIKLTNLFLMPFTCLTAAATGGWFWTTFAGHMVVQVGAGWVWKHYFYRVERPDLDPKNWVPHPHYEGVFVPRAKP